MATISILIPTYNGSKYLKPTIDSIISQSYSDFEIIINDDCSTDKTIDIIKSYQEPRIFLSVNKTNLGYSRNLEKCRTKANGKYIFLMGQDDILAANTLRDIIKTFHKYPHAGAITRPYYWFFNQVEKPVRYKKSFNISEPKLVKISDSRQDVIRVFDSLDQLSGLCYRADLMTSFHPDIFPCHIYPFSKIFLKHPVIYLPRYTIAVRIASSQTRFLSSIYNKSPLQSWIDMVNNLKLPSYLISDFIAINYVGLVQIKNYSSFKNLLREIWLLIKYRHKNLLSPAFWFFSLGTIFTPPFILIPLVDWYKNQIYSKSLKTLKIET